MDSEGGDGDTMLEYAALQCGLITRAPLMESVDLPVAAGGSCLCVRLSINRLYVGDSPIDVGFRLLVHLWSEPRKAQVRVRPTDVCIAL